MRDGLTQTLTRRGHDVVAAVADAEALRQAVRHAPARRGHHRRAHAARRHTDEGLRAAQSIRQDHPQVGVLVFSQYIETRSAAELFAGSPAGVGYLLKDRVADVSDFIDAITRVARAAPCSTRKSSASFCGASRRADCPGHAHRRGSGRCSRSWPRAARTPPSPSALVISAGVVEKHVASIFAKLGLAPSDNDNRRVIAAIRYLES